MNKKRQNIRTAALLRFAMIVSLIVVVNIIGNFVFTRFDLTSEKTLYAF